MKTRTYAALKYRDARRKFIEDYDEGVDDGSLPPPRIVSEPKALHGLHGEDCQIILVGELAEWWETLHATGCNVTAVKG